MNSIDVRRGPLAVLAAVALGLLSATAVASGPEHATGYFTPPKGGIKARRIVGAKGPGMLRAAPKSALPARWDSRDQGWVSPVKSQGNVGACWAFAAFATLETQLLKSGRGLYDFSEKNMASLHGWDVSPDDGGNSDVAAGYLLRWGGAVAETNDVYRSSLYNWDLNPSKPMPPAVRVQNVVWFEPLDGSQERADALKAAVLEYGAVFVSVHWNTAYISSASYYCPTNRELNHAVTLVGWDDEWPTNSFKTPPPGPGAWIIKNSWGVGSGDGGYLWVSYHDKSFSKDSGSVFVPAGEDEDYDAVRGHDRLGVVYDVSSQFSDVPARQYDLQAAVFTSAWGETLAAVGVWSSFSPAPYEISVYTNVVRGGGSPVAGGVLARRQTGTLDHAGFTTVHLDSPLGLADGDTFSVVYRQTGETRSTCVNCTVVDMCNPVHSRGDSFFGRVAGDGTVEWVDGVDEAPRVDVTDASWGACIKAYTRLSSPVRAADAPDEGEDGTEYLADLAATNAVLFAETGESFGASALLAGANGRSLWASWLVGLDPSDPADSELSATISVSNGVPMVGWSPDLGERRSYTVWGSADPGGGWAPVDASDPGSGGLRFFRVSVGR